MAKRMKVAGGWRGDARSQAPLLALALLVAGLLLAAACAPSAPTESPPATTTASPQPQTPNPTAARPTGAVPVTPATSITLTVWWPDSLTPPADEEDADVLHSQLDAFQEANPNVRVNLSIKKAQGQGSILTLLRTGYSVAPSILPDLVVLREEDLGAAVQAGLLQPLDGLVAPSLLEDLYPFSAAVGQFPEGQMALQFTADVEHLAYNTQKVLEPPVTWTEVLSGTARYIFPAGGSQGRVNKAFLIQYLAIGGRLLDENGQPALDKALLARVLGFYAQALERKTIHAGILEVTSLDACWDRFIESGAGLANVAASRYMAERESHPEVQFAPLPTWNGTVTTMARGWVLAVVAQDQPHQRAAADLLAWLLDPPRNAAWNVQMGLLPTQREALALLGNQDPYYAFLHWQLESAHPYPAAPGFGPVAQALQKAVRDVLSGTASPEESAQAVLKALGQPTE